MIAAFDAEEQAAAEEAKKQKQSKKQLHLTNLSSLPLQHVQQGSPAHTWQKKPSSKGEEMVVTVRVETNGASGVGNRLTAEEIAKAEGVIIAADKAVETARFDGKN